MQLDHSVWCWVVAITKKVDPLSCPYQNCLVHRVPLLVIALLTKVESSIKENTENHCYFCCSKAWNFLLLNREGSFLLLNRRQKENPGSSCTLLQKGEDFLTCPSSVLRGTRGNPVLLIMNLVLLIRFKGSGGDNPEETER